MGSLHFQLELAWSQISVFDANLVDPYNDWNEQHLSQGFSWRPGSVSFKLPVRSGTVAVDVDLIERIVVDPSARSAIVVPFISWAGVIEVSSITQAELIEVDSGQYALLYQSGIRDGEPWVSLGLMAATRTGVEPMILRSDENIDAEIPLLMEAEPAA